MPPCLQFVGLAACRLIIEHLFAIALYYMKKSFKTSFSGRFRNNYAIALRFSDVTILHYAVALWEIVCM